MAKNMFVDYICTLCFVAAIQCFHSACMWSLVERSQWNPATLSTGTTSGLMAWNCGLLLGLVDVFFGPQGRLFCRGSRLKHRSCHDHEKLRFSAQPAPPIERSEKGGKGWARAKRNAKLGAIPLFWELMDRAWVIVPSCGRIFCRRYCDGTCCDEKLKAQPTDQHAARSSVRGGESDDEEDDEVGDGILDNWKASWYIMIGSWYIISWNSWICCLARVSTWFAAGHWHPALCAASWVWSVCRALDQGILQGDLGMSMSPWEVEAGEQKDPKTLNTSRI